MKKIWILHHSTNIESYENEKLIQALSKAGFDVQIYEPKYFTIIVSKCSKRTICYKNEIVNFPNLILSRTGSGSNYSTFALMRQFEKFNIPVINDSVSVSTVADKLLTSQLLAKEGLPVPKTILINGEVDTNLIEEEIGFPCVIKATTGSKGKTVYLCKSKKEFKRLTDLLNAISLKKVLIVQEFVNASPGVDLRVWVINGKTVAAMKRTGPKGDFRANLSNGGTAEYFEITEEIDFIARETARVLGLQIAGIDLLFTKHGVTVCEANSSPGFEGMDKYCGTDMSQKIVEFINLKLS